MAKRYDLVIIGTGTVAMVVSGPARAAGWSVAVIDHRPFGGTCMLRGCNPKKALVNGAAVIDAARRMGTKGVTGGLRIDWPALMAFKGSLIEGVSQQQEEGYGESGIDTFHGRARFTGPNTLEVGSESLEAGRILIGTGAEPISLGIPGEEHLTTSEGFLELERLPDRIVMVGGGYIASEFSHVAAHAGAQVTVLQRGPRLLEGFDPDLVELLMERFREIGIEVRTRATVEAVEKTAEGFTVRASSGGAAAAFEADLVVHAAGRGPALDGLDLARGGVEVEKGRLVLNDFLQSVSNPAVYAAGDAAGKGPPLTPVSSHDAKVAAVNLLEGNRLRPNYLGVPSVCFTIPPIASVGLSEDEAHRQGVRIRVRHERMSDWYGARIAAEPIAGFKVLVEEGRDRIVGAHLVGHHAEEVINLFALAIRKGLSAEDLKSAIFAYPTGASDAGSML